MPVIGFLINGAPDVYAEPLAVPRPEDQYRSCGVSGKGVFLRRFKMQKHVLVLTTSTFILACGAIAASAQQGSMMQQPPQMPQQQEHHDWRGGTMGPGMMGRGGMMGSRHDGPRRYDGVWVPA